MPCALKISIDWKLQSVSTHEFMKIRMSFGLLFPRQVLVTVPEASDILDGFSLRA